MQAILVYDPSRIDSPSYKKQLECYSCEAKRAGVDVSLFSPEKLKETLATQGHASTFVLMMVEDYGLATVLAEAGLKVYNGVNAMVRRNDLDLTYSLLAAYDINAPKYFVPIKNGSNFMNKDKIEAGAKKQGIKYPFYVKTESDTIGSNGTLIPTGLDLALFLRDHDQEQITVLEKIDMEKAVGYVVGKKVIALAKIESKPVKGQNGTEYNASFLRKDRKLNNRFVRRALTDAVAAVGYGYGQVTFYVKKNMVIVFSVDPMMETMPGEHVTKKAITRAWFTFMKHDSKPNTLTILTKDEIRRRKAMKTVYEHLYKRKRGK